MKITVALIQRLKELADGKTLTASSLRGDWFQQMQADGILIAVTHGSRKGYRAADKSSFMHYIASQYDIRDLDATLNLLQQEESERSSQVEVTGDSKFIRHRTFQGFLVNSYQPIPAMLNGDSMTILPTDGSWEDSYWVLEYSTTGEYTCIGFYDYPTPDGPFFGPCKAADIYQGLLVRAVVR